MASVADILLAQARAAGDARRARGAILGHTVATLGQMPAQMIAQHEDDQRRDAALGVQQQEIDRRTKADERQEAQYQSEQDAKNHETALRTAVNIADAGYPQAAVDDFVQFRLPKLWAGSEEESAALAERSQTPEGRKAIIDGLIATAPKDPPKYVVVGKSLIDTKNPSEPVYTEPTAEKPLPEAKTYRVVTKGPNGRPVTKIVTEDELRQGVQEYVKPEAPRGPIDPGPLETIIGDDGKPRRVTRADAVGKAPASGTEKASSGVQKRVLNFFNRAEQADKDLEGMEEQVQALGLIGQERLAHAPNWAQTQLGQSYTAAQRAFTEARLRKDSGAAIPEQEFKNDRQTYFAQPGDSKETLAQKRRARAAMLASLGFESGQALGEFLGSADEAREVVEGYKARSKQGTVAPVEHHGGAAPAKKADPLGIR